MLTWFMFQFGQAMHLLAQIDQVARAKNNLHDSRIQIFRDRWIPISVRTFLTTIFFGMFLGGGLPKILGAFGMESPSWVITLSVLLSQTGLVGDMLAGAVGFGADSALSLIPKLKSFIPPSLDDLVKLAATKEG